MPVVQDQESQKKISSLEEVEEGRSPKARRTSGLQKESCSSPPPPEEHSRRNCKTWIKKLASRTDAGMWRQLAKAS